MENFIKTLFISLLMSGSFMTDAMEDHGSDDTMARSLGMSLEDYRREVAIQQELFSQVPAPQNNKDLDPELEQAIAASLGMNVHEYRRHIAQSQEKESERLAFLLQAEDEKNMQEKESLRLAHQLQLEESERLTHKLAEEETSSDLIRRLQESHIQEGEGSIKQQIRNKTWQYSRGTERSILEEFMSIFNHLNSISQNSDVHVLDDYVFRSKKMIDALLKVGRLYNIDNSNLTLTQVGQEMISFVNKNKGFFDTYKYEINALNGEQVIAILNSHFATMDTEIKAVSPAAQEVWSRAWTLALNLYNQDDDISAIQVIFDQAVEGHLTRGGCIQGRINRGFVGYVSLLAKSGVNLY